MPEELADAYRLRPQLCAALVAGDEMGACQGRPRGLPYGELLVQRRRFLVRFTQALAALGAAPALARIALRVTPTGHNIRLHLQDCRIAGSHYYDCDAVLGCLRPGDRVQLRRQSGNPHDDRAIEVFWHEHKLGYLPRLDNAAAASLIDRTRTLYAEIIGIDDPDEEWEPVRLRVWVSTAVLVSQHSKD